MNYTSNKGKSQVGGEMSQISNIFKSLCKLRKNIHSPAQAGLYSVSKKCLAEFAAVAANKVKSIFGRGVYLDENTSQAASVRVVRRRRTRSACSRLQKNCRKAPWGIFDSLTAQRRLGCVKKNQFLTCFMDRLMRWRFSSTDSTTTLTTSPTFTTSLGWRRRREQTSEMCTSPS